MAENRRLIAAGTRVLVALVALLLVSAAFFFIALPRLLVLNNSSPADYIAVLDGHDDNYYEGLRLLKSGMAKKMFVCLDLPDVPLHGEEVQKDLAFVRRTAGRFADAIEICENDDEDALTEFGSLLETTSAQRVLIVTPASESRAQYLLAKRHFADVTWSVDPSKDRSFNVNWWRRREWADTYVQALERFAAALRGPQAVKTSVQRSSK